MNTAVKNEIKIPIISVVAKPRIGPVPKLNRMIPVMIDVKLESKIAKEAWSGMEGGMPALNVYGTTAEEFNKEVKADMMPFVFKEEGYLYPIQQEYLNKNPKLVQNPNW